jgi:hypothetical protein
VRLVVLCLASSWLGACGGARDTDPRTITREVEAQLAAARDATIPRGVALLSRAGPTRASVVVSAEWSFEAPMDWLPYLHQAEASLRRAGHEAWLSSPDERILTKHVPGDTYSVRLVHDAAAPKRVMVTFLASPD